MPTQQQKRLLFGNSVFNPLSIANLAYWSEARFVTNKNDGDALGSSWLDLSGNNRHAAQATGTKQPIFKTNISGDIPFLRFDLVDDFLQTPSFDLTGTNAITLFAIIANVASGTDRIIAEFSANLNTVSNLGFGLTRDTANTISIATRGSVGFSNFTTTGTVTTTPTIISAIIDKSLSTNEATVWLNGTSAGARGFNSNNTDNFGSQPLYIGMRGGTTLPFGGDLGGLLLFSRALATSERQYIERGLGTIYKITTA